MASSGGLLSLKHRRTGVIRAQDVDWKKSIWWGEGGYVGKLHISPFVSKSPKLLVEELRERLQVQCLDRTVKLLEPSEVYPEVRGYPPTLFVSVSDLTIRCIGSISAGVHYGQKTMTWEQMLPTIIRTAYSLNAARAHTD